MDTLANLGEVGGLDWEENDEKITIANDEVPRFCKLSEIVDILTRDGESMNFLFLSICLVCLPSISSPAELCTELMRKLTEPATLAMSSSRREQIQMKVMVIMRSWARSSAVYCDFSGPVIEIALDIAKEGIHSDYAPVVAAGKKVKAALKVIRDDLRDIEKAQSIFQSRVSKMRALFNNNPQSAGKASHEVMSPNPQESSNHRHWEIGKIVFDDINNSSVSVVGNNNVGNNISNSNSNNNAINSSNGEVSGSYPEGGSSLLANLARDRVNSGGSSFSFASVNLSRESPSTPYLTDDLNSENVFTGVDIDLEDDVNTREHRNSLFENDSDMRKFGLRDSVHSPEHIPVSPIKSPISPRRRTKSPKISIIQSMPFEQLANFLTIYEFEDYVLSVRPRELIDMSWTKKDLKSVHPDLGGSANLSRAIFYTNQTIAWVAREIIDYASYFGPTADAIEYFIRTAKAVLEKNNFNTFFLIVSALSLPAVRQLKAGWSHVATKKRELFQKFLEICSSNGNYSNYRKALSKVVDAPHILSIQVLIKDIVFLETSGPWRSGGVIDIKKAFNMHSMIGSYVHLENGISKLVPYEVTIKNLEYAHPVPPEIATPRPSLRPKGKASGNGRSILEPDESFDPLTSPIYSPKLTDSFISPEDHKGSSATSNEIGINSNMAAETTPVAPTKISNLSFKVVEGDLSHPSFIFNMRVARDSFFGPLHEDYQNFDTNQRYSILTPDATSPGAMYSSSSTSPSQSLTPSAISPSRYSITSMSPNSPNRNQSKKTKFINFFKRLVGVRTNGEFALEGDDVNLAILQSHLSSINPDLNALWQDAKYADKVESRRLVGKLASAGLY